MAYLRRMGKAHPGLRTFLSVLLSAAMVLSSVPTQAFAEAVADSQGVGIEVVEDEPSAVDEQELATGAEESEGEELDDQQDEAIPMEEQVVDEQDEAEQVASDDPEEQQSGDGDQGDQQIEELETPKAGGPLRAQASPEVYTVKFYERNGDEISGMPDDIKSQNPSVFGYLTDEDGKIVGWNNFPIDQNSCQVTIGTAYNSGTYSSDGAVTYDPDVHKLNLRVIHDYSYAGEFMPWDMASINFNGKDQFDGYKFVSDNPEPNTFKLQRDWNKQLQVEVSYTGSDTSDSAPGTIIVRAKTTTSGWHYFKYPLSQVSWQSGAGTIIIDDWKLGDGSSSGHNFSNAWQNIEAVLFKGDVSIPDVKNVLETGQGTPKPVYAVAGYVLKSGEVESREGSVDEQTGMETLTLPVVLDGTPLDPATTPEAILGDAAEYGIVAGTYNQTGHTETNYAVKTLKNNSDFDLDYHEMGRMPLYIGEIDGVFKLNGDKGYAANADLYITREDVEAGKIVKLSTQDNPSVDINIIPTPKDAINAHVDALINHVDEMSKAMSQKVTIAPKPASNDQDYVLDTTSLPNNTTIYVDATNLMTLWANKKFSINKLPGQYIVFNIPGKNVEINSFTVSEEGGLQNVGTRTAELDGNHAYNEQVDQAIISKICLNAYEATHVHLGSDPVAGAVLAPKASEVIVDASSAGWVVAKGEVTTRSEWHFYHKTKTYDGVPGDDVNITATKTITGGNGTERTLNFELNYAGESAGNPVATGTVTLNDGTSSPITFNPLAFKYVLGASYKLGSDNKTLEDEQIPYGAESLAQLEKDGRATVETIGGKRVWTIVYKLTEKNFDYTDLEKDVAEATITVKVTEDESNLDFVVSASLDPENAEIKNKAKSTAGTLTIKKTIGGVDVTDEELAEGAIKFQVTTTVDGKKMYLTGDGELTEQEATLTLGEDDTWVKADGQPVWTKTFEGVPAGDYTVTETNSALKGYTLNDGSGQPAGATVEAGKEATAEVTDEYTKDEAAGTLTIKKIVSGVTEGTTVSNQYKITITNAEGKYVNADGEFQSDAYKHTITNGQTLTFDNLPVGTYTVAETDDNLVVDGYVFQNKTVEGAGNVTKDATSAVTITNTYKQTKVTVSKVDIADGKELAGAHIQVLDSKGNIVHKWTSTTEAHKITGLKTGETYTLRETVAPNGYDVTTDITFTIDEHGKVTTTGTMTSDGTILIEDAAQPKKQDDKKQENKSGSKKIPQTSDPMMALDAVSLGLAGMGSALVASGIAARRRREER